MGDEKISVKAGWWRDPFWITNPYKTESLRGAEKARQARGQEDEGKKAKEAKKVIGSAPWYEVIYYFTNRQGEVESITDEELTPIVLEEGKVIGWGRPILAVAIAGKGATEKKNITIASKKNVTLPTSPEDT